MKHLNEDTLLNLSLELLEDDEKAAATNHLAECAECREAFAKVTGDVERLSSFEPELSDPAFPLPKRTRSGRMWLLRAAALLLIGFASGFGVSRYYQGSCVNVFPYSARGASPTIAKDGLVVCETEALKVDIR